MATRFAVPVTQVVNDDASGIGSGWKLNFYTTGTSTRKDTFSDNALTTANANPVVADSSGRFGDVFLEDGTYKVVLTDGDDVVKWTADPVSGSLGTSGAVIAKTASYTVVTGDATKLVNMDATSGSLTVTLLTAASATDGFEVSVKKTDSSVNTVTIDGNGAETIDGVATLVLSNQYDEVTLRCDGSNWFVVAADHGGLGRSTFWKKGADIASAGPLVLGTDGNYFDVTGTTGFAALTVRAGILFMLQFDGALTLTHHATNLDLPGEADITTAAGDVLIGFATGANTVQVLSYTKADGTAVVSGVVRQIVNTETGAVATGTTVIPDDDTIPQNTEGDQYMSLSITPKFAASTLKIMVAIMGANSAAGPTTAALFKDSGANALAGMQDHGTNIAANNAVTISFTHSISAGATSAQTFKVRIGGTAGTFTFNGRAGARKLGGVLSSSIIIIEHG